MIILLLLLLLLLNYYHYYYYLCRYEIKQKQQTTNKTLQTIYKRLAGSSQQLTSQLLWSQNNLSTRALVSLRGTQRPFSLKCF